MEEIEFYEDAPIHVRGKQCPGYTTTLLIKDLGGDTWNARDIWTGIIFGVWQATHYVCGYCALKIMFKKQSIAPPWESFERRM